MKKILGVIVAVVLIALIGAGAYMYFSFSGLVKSAVETYAPRFTQTKVTLGGVSASIFGGSATINDLVIGNPSGFKSPEAISIGKATLSVDTGSVMSPVIHVKTIEVIAPHITYEPGQGSNNLSVIQKNVTKATQTSAAQPPATKDQAKDTSAQAPEKKFIIDRLTISGAQATIALPQMTGATQLVGQNASTAVTLPTIDMRDLGAKEGGLPPAKIAEQVMSRLQQQAQQSVGNSAKGLMDKVGSGAGGLVDQGTSAGGGVGGQLKGLLGK
ncbi:MAG TPA: hypothetical protein VL966_15155 [Alphaproteobacteria bacterium]|nr:hypothetical protein [Alphaproteobacteria bacterium]